MGKLNYIQGNLFDSPREIIAHGVNCRGAFGSGVAGQIARLYPLVRNAYFEKHQTDGWKLGDMEVVRVNPKKYIANLATQDTFGSAGVHVDYDACFMAFDSLLRFAEKNQMNVAMPKIGAGLAGGQWELVEQKLLKALEGREVEVDVYYL